MQTFLLILADAMRRLAGAGAVNNAACEVDRAARSVIELHARLGGLEPPRRAA
ncbi:MAG: hypothetical protein ACYDA2_06505 [Acidimicrobiales bacterium]